MDGGPGTLVVVPDALASSHARHSGDRGRAWIAALPGLAADILDRWALRPDGPPAYGAVALVLPVRLADGTPAVVKLQPVDEETVGEPGALRAWNGHHAVCLLRHDPTSGSMLLERLSADRTLAGVPDDLVALRTLSTILGGLNAVTAPPGTRRLADVAAALLDRVPDTLAKLSAPADRRLIRRCAAAVEEVLPEPGDRLLHWDLHYANVLARRPGPQPPDDPTEWVAIDPKPLAGDPGFELLPALHNRWDDIMACGDVHRAIRRRYDLMTDLLGLDRHRAAAWTLGRVLQNLSWEIARDPAAVRAHPDRAVAQVILDRY